MGKKLKVWERGENVRVLFGKHTGETGIVQHSDRSITTVLFDRGIDPVWTVHLEKVQS